ncbi:MAG: glycosyltransferase [Draconibacterium sp.]|nr:glycosyltransferase [Draconibacterium sp.]
MNPKVSVILPFFNAEKTLKAAIKSILKQSFYDFELLLINNNSTDSSFTIANSFAEKDSRIRLLIEKKQGVANAMNCGLKNARGKFIARMDADDISMPRRLEKQLQYLNNNPEIDFVGSNVKYVPHNKNSAGFERFVEWANSFYSPKQIDLNCFVEIPVINPTIFFRRELFEKLGGCFDSDFPEDYEMQLRYLAAGVKMAKLDEQLLEWHDYSMRLTRTDNRYSTEAFFKTKAKYFKSWSVANNPFHPNIWVWGAGRKTRQRAKLLEKEGIVIDGFIDIIKFKTTLKTTIHYSEIPKPDNIFIVSMVTKSGVREQIKEFLVKENYVEGVDFILMG